MMPKPSCTYYYGGRGICSKGDSCDFSHDECLPRRREKEAEITNLREQILSAVGGDVEAYNAFASTVSDYRHRRITVQCFLALAEAAKLSHILPTVAQTFKYKLPYSFCELSSALEHSEQEKRLKAQKEKGDCSKKLAQKLLKKDFSAKNSSKTSEEEHLQKEKRMEEEHLQKERRMKEKEKRMKEREKSRRLLSFDQEDYDTEKENYDTEKEKRLKEKEKSRRLLNQDTEKEKTVKEKEKNRNQVDHDKKEKTMKVSSQGHVNEADGGDSNNASSFSSSVSDDHRSDRKQINPDSAKDSVKDSAKDSVKDSAKGYKGRGMAHAMFGEWAEAAKDLHVASTIDCDEEISAVLKLVEPNLPKLEEHRP